MDAPQFQQLSNLRQWFHKIYYAPKKDIPKLFQYFLQSIVPIGNQFCDDFIGLGKHGEVIQSKLPSSLLFPTQDEFHDYVIKKIPLLPYQPKPNNPFLPQNETPSNDLIHLIDSHQHFLLLCQKIPWIEIIVNTMLNEFLIQKISPHFLTFGGFSLCKISAFPPSKPNEKFPLFQLFFEKIFKSTPERYISFRDFMDVSHHSIIQLDSFLLYHQQTYHTIDPVLIDSVLISVLHSLHIMNSSFHITHNDLHIGNIFISFFSEAKDSFSRELTNKKYFGYVVPHESNPDLDEIYYLPNLQWIVKIADFGFSSFSLPHFAGISQDTSYFRSKRTLFYNPEFPQINQHSIPDYLLLFRDLEPYHHPTLQHILHTDPMFQLPVSLQELYHGTGSEILQPKFVRTPADLLHLYFAKYRSKPKDLVSDDDLILFNPKNLEIPNPVTPLPTSIPIQENSPNILPTTSQ